MLKNILFAFAPPLENIRTRFFHTVLSILDIVIGVAALVAILSLIDGMELYAQEQITKTTALKAILVQPSPYKSANEVRALKNDYAYFTNPSFQKLRSSLTKPANGYLYTDTISRIQSIAYVGKYWGFLKYYHPIVAQGNLNWDEKLFYLLKKINDIKHKAQLSAILIDELNQLGEVPPCKSCSYLTDESLKENLDFNWLENDDILSNELKLRLKYILRNRNQGKNYYVSWNMFRNRLEFSNEKDYSEMALPNENYRFLALFRYWNIIQYFHPTKSMLPYNWNKVLIGFIPKFESANDTLVYQNTIQELTATIMDGHAEFTIPQKFIVKRKWFLPPFTFDIVKDIVIVKDYYNKRLSNSQDIRIGDKIIAINKKSISDYIDERSLLLSTSNISSKVERVSAFLLSGRTDSINITIYRSGEILQKKIKRYPFDSLDYKFPNNDTEVYKVMSSNIGYINLGNLTNGDVKNVMSQLWDTKGIILDARFYPKGTYQQLCDYLNSEEREFAYYTKPDLNYPGVFRKDSGHRVGKKNAKHYMGKVAILCDARTQSAGETTCLALRTVSNSKIIGRQTAGADGDVAIVTFPGGYQTRFTGTGVYTIDGKPIQHNGVPIDIVVEKDADEVLNNIDKSLNAALKWINEP